MEKFARQALLDGVTDPDDLVISRDSELFRTLNTHYNKGNDFEVSLYSFKTWGGGQDNTYSNPNISVQAVPNSQGFNSTMSLPSFTF